MKKNQNTKLTNRFDVHSSTEKISFADKIAYSPWSSLTVIAIACVVAYSNSFGCTFHLDDTVNIVDNSHIRNLWNFADIWLHDKSRFIAKLSFAINYHLGGLNVWGYHLVNLLIHIFNAFLVWWLIRLIFSSPAIINNNPSLYKNQIAFFAALLFVVHPLATQSVTYIVQRMASLVTLFYLLSICTYVKGRLLPSTSAEKIIMYGLSAASAILAFFTKENAFTLPIAIVLTEYCFFSSRKEVSQKNTRWFLLLCGIVLLTAFLVFSRFSLSIFNPVAPAHGNTYTVTSLGYLLTQFSVILKYIQLLILPYQQNLDYDYPPVKGFFEIKTFLSFLILAAVLFFAFKIFKKHLIIAFSVFWFFLTLSIESSIVPIEDLIFEHRTYLPSFGFFLLLCYSLYTFLPSSSSAMLGNALIILCGIYCYLTYERNKVWKDPITMWTDVTKKSPNKARAFGSLGDAYRDSGQIQNALKAYNRSVEINPKYATGQLNVGAMYSKLFQWDKAYKSYTLAISADSNYTKAYYNRGITSYTLEKNESAISDYNKAIALDKKYKTAYFGRASCYHRLGRYSEAIVDYTSAIELDSAYSDGYFYRGSAFIKLQNWARAAEDFRTVLALNQNYSKAWFNLGVCYMSLKNWQDALNAFTEGGKREPNFADNYINKGVCYGNLGKWKEALESYEQAIMVDPNNAIAKNNKNIAISKVTKSSR